MSSGWRLLRRRWSPTRFTAALICCGGMPLAKKNLNVVDLTGAGDLFAAGYLHGYINKLTIKESLEKGTEMSSKIIQQIGARLS